MTNDRREPPLAPRVSVLLPAYNTREEYLREAIESILGQTFSHFELLIINDASTDTNVEKVILSYCDPRIRYYANQCNLGISGTRNRLLDLARGDYLAIMDHDDVSLPKRLEKEVAYLDAHPDVGVVSGTAEIMNHRKISVLAFPEEDPDIKLGLIKDCVLIHSASMIRKSVLDKYDLRYEPQFTLAEDYALWCRLIPHTQFHNLSESLLRYRYHDANTSIIQKEKWERALLAVQCMVKADNPALYDNFMESVKHVTKVKLFGCIPFLRIVKYKRRCTCTIFGIPLFRSKNSHEP